jgi:hypothetical protein
MLRNAAISICLSLLAQIFALPPLDDDTRAKINAYLETPFTRVGQGHAEHARKLQGIDDDVRSALATLGPKVEMAMKDRLLRMAGRGEIFEELGTHPYNDLLQDINLIKNFVGKELGKRRLEAKPIDEPKPTPDASVYSSVPPHGAYNVTKLSDGRTVHRFGLSGPASKVHGSNGRRLFGTCKQDRVIATFTALPLDVSGLTEDVSGETCMDGTIEEKNFPYPGLNPYKDTYCTVREGKTFAIPPVVEKLALVGYNCPQFPGFTDDSLCDVQKDTLPGSVKCKLELAVMPSFSITFQMDLEFGYGGKGEEKDMIAELSVGVYTSQLPRPCLGASADPVCEALMLLSNIMNEFVDIGGSLGGAMMKDTVSMFPVRFGFPAGYEGAKNTGQKLFRLPIFSGVDAAGSQVTSGVSLQSGGMCLSTIGSKLGPSVGRIKMQLQAVGFLLSLSGSDLCIETPGVMKTGSGSLQTGLKVKGYALDKTKVSVAGLWDLFPPSLSPIVNGMKTSNDEPMDFKGLKELFSDGGDDSLNSKVEQSIKEALPDAKVAIEIDIAEKAHLAQPDVATVKEGDNYLFRIDNVFATGRRLSSDQAPVEHDYVVLPIPAGPHPGLQTRRLQTAYKIPKFIANIQDGSKCIVTVTGMPKTLQCDLVLELAPGINLYLRGQVKLFYDMKGTGMLMSSGFGFKLAFPEGEADQATKDAITKFENIFDLGAMIDPMLEKGVTLMPAAIKLPPTYDDGTSVLEVAQLAVPELKKEGLCITTMEKLEGVPAMLLDLVKNILTFTGVVGGDACIKSPNLDVATGFKMDMHAEGTVFDKSKVNLWPIIQEISALNPTLKIIIDICEIILPQPVKDALNTLVADLMPDQIVMTYNIGAAIANATARRLTSARGRRLSSSSLVGEDGVFDLGGIPASDAPGSVAKGTPKTAADLPAGTAQVSVPATAGGGGGGDAANTGGTSDAVRSAQNAIPLLIVGVAAFALES